MQLADESVCIGEAQSSESYLNIPNIIAAAVSRGADAIHPVTAAPAAPYRLHVLFERLLLMLRKPRCTTLLDVRCWKPTGSLRSLWRVAGWWAGVWLLVRKRHLRGHMRGPRHRVHRSRSQPHTHHGRQVHGPRHHEGAPAAPLAPLPPPLPRTTLNVQSGKVKGEWGGWRRQRASPPFPAATGSSRARMRPWRWP